MDARITKKRIGQMLSYDWIKILALIVAAIVVWSFVFTSTATRLNPAQKFTIYAYMGTTTEDRFYTKAVSENETGWAYGFSYDVIETETVDLSSAGNQAYDLLSARTGVKEGNVVFVPDALSSSTGTTAAGEEYTLTYLQDLLAQTYAKVLTAESVEGSKTSYFARTEEFLSEYYSNLSDESTFDEEKVEATFRARIEEQGDKRYKKEAQILAGIEEEKARIRGYRDNYLAVRYYLDTGVIALQESTVHLTTMNGVRSYTGYYSINLCPDESKMPGLKDLVWYKTENDEGTEIETAKNMQLVLLDLLGDEYGYGIFENYAFIRRVVETCCAESVEKY